VEPDPKLRALWLDLSLGLVAPTQGQILWFGQPCPRTEDFWAVCAWRARLGWVGQTGQLISGRPLLENLALYYEYALGYPPSQSLAAAWGWLEKLDLTQEAQTPGERLAADQLPLARLALALVKEPELLLLDQPRRLFNQDFPRVWKLLLAEKATRDFALVILDHREDHWGAELASQTLSLWAPGQAQLTGGAP
jgi:ABC-type lipoprotein export system ATPase subunit